MTYIPPSGIPAIDDLIAHVKKQLRGTAPEPEWLWHYTTGAGLLGIYTKPRRLWATNSLYMNDRSELTYGIEVLRSQVEPHLKQTGPQADVARALAEVAARRHTNPHLVSFSERHDDLVQWLVYADLCRGYAIGLPRERLEQPPAPRGHPRGITFHLLRVVYSPDLQVKLVNDLVGKATQLLEADAIHRNEIYTAVGYLGQLMLMSFKAQDFEHEREWRLAASLQMGAEVPFKFRATPRGIAPYLEYEIDGERGSARSRIFWGSALDSELQAQTMERFSRVSGFMPEAEPSKVRYRP